uniref:Setae polypeptide n=1 Tax=Ochrogaster lunifer TaxID=319761 RepID=A0AA49ETM4_OCHLU|nr:setae polypeptide [Ochrogaster lunifer]
MNGAFKIILALCLIAQVLNCVQGKPAETEEQEGVSSNSGSDSSNADRAARSLIDATAICAKGYVKDPTNGKCRELVD